LSQIDFWIGLINNEKNLENQISIIKISNDEIKKLNYKKIAIKRIKISFEEKSWEDKQKSWIEEKNLKNLINKWIQNQKKTKNVNFQWTQWW
jgi:hypothetical protein